MKPLNEKLEDYFKNKSNDEILKDWNETAKYDGVGPTVDEYLNFLKLIEMQKLLDSHKRLYELIRKIINYEQVDDSPIAVYLDEPWFIDNTKLVILFDDEEFEGFEQWYEYHYTISSLGTKGKELYMGVHTDYTVIMAYPEDGNWEDSSIFILSNEKQIKE